MLLLFLLISLLIFQCSIEKPSAPTWNLKLTVPLTNRYYDMASLVDRMNEPYLKTDSLGNLCFGFEEELDTIRLTNNLRCDSAFYHFKDTLGIISVHASEFKTNSLSISNFYSGPPGIVPPCTVTVESDLDTFSTYSQVTVKDAYCTITLSNHLGLDLDWLQIRIIDQKTQDTLQTVISPQGITDGDSDFQIVILQNKTMSNHLEMELTGSLSGGVITDLENKYFNIYFSLDSLAVIQGIVKSPSFEVQCDQEILLSTHSLIDSARIKAGTLLLNLQNFTGISSDVQINLPSLTRDGTSLSGQCHLSAYGPCNLPLTLDGYTFQPDGENRIKMQIEVKSNGPGEDLVHFTSSDSICSNALLSEVFFSKIIGVIEPTKIQIEDITRDLNLPPGFESAHLTHASLNLDIHNGVDLPAQLQMTIRGDKQQELNLSAEIAAGGPFGTSITSLFEDQIQSLLNPVPKTLTVSGEVVCGDGQTYGVVREEDFFFGRIRVNSPVEMVFDSCQVKVDEDSEEVNDDVKDLIINQVNSSGVVLKIESHLPLYAKARIFLSRNPDSIFSNPDLVVGPINVPKGELNPDGSVKTSILTQSRIDLTYSDLQVFASAPFYLAGILDFPGSSGQIIKASAADYIRIMSYLEIDVKNKKE
ncbi:MAG TPA: hypothetical protein VF369_00835 [candidate division Zixibacteria bacterium]